MLDKASYHNKQHVEKMAIYNIQERTVNQNSYYQSESMFFPYACQMFKAISGTDLKKDHWLTSAVSNKHARAEEK